MFEIHVDTQSRPAQKSSPSKAAKTDSIFAQEIFFQLLASRAVSYSIFIIMLCLLDATASFHFPFLCIVFDDLNWESVHVSYQTTEG